MTDAAQLNKWFEREAITGVQAAFMLAGAIPVKNPRPNMKGAVGDWYGHILDAVKAGRLATVGPVERRIDVSAEYIDSLTMDELERFESEWRALDHPAELDTSQGTYRFLVEPATLAAWAGMSGRQHISDAGASHETPNVKGNGLRVAAIRLIEAKSGTLGSSPHAAITAMNEGLRGAGMGRPLSETSPTLRDAVALAQKKADPEYPQKLPSKGRDQIAALWKLVAHRYEVTPHDIDALLELVKGMTPPSRKLMEDVIGSI